jgi:hypothetical protein
MSFKTAYEWLAVAWSSIKTFFGRVWTASKSAIKVCFSDDQFIPKLAVGFIVALAAAIYASATVGMIWWAFPLSVMLDTINVAFLLTGIHVVALSVYRFFVPEKKVFDAEAVGRKHMRKQKAAKEAMRVVA